MIAKEILKKIKQIQFKINRLSDEATSGHYASAFKGSGIEFAEVREYYPGDDVRSIDWNVTARNGRPFIKRYVEERELTVMLAVDLSASQYFGSAGSLKSELAAEISALLAFLAIKNNDRVGLLIFTDRVEKYIPPQKGRRHVLRVIREILAYRPDSTGTDIRQALDFINKVTKHRSIVFLLSDFWDTQCERSLRQTARRHDLVAVRISDPREGQLPAVGLVEFTDRESGRKVLFDTSDPRLRQIFQENAQMQYQTMSRILRSSKVDSIEVSTAVPYLEPLQRFFLKRERQVR
ncbi:uncharacterized protein DUF58 [Hydrogenispora ethanolica]|uniref:Uncharacterized protein DUF58 n=1 Tax=Hydrogenispora ethanolica TaxID=1082276 RepID=A0A4R1RD79_HYDET|nr:DUF58 domain-containing protein [Hydrogenispora ethanolica]TCL63776.1 uncharacterized protein DUF58 [Hydrogenispora ethanolica]